MDALVELPDFKATIGALNGDDQSLELKQFDRKTNSYNTVKSLSRIRHYDNKRDQQRPLFHTINTGSCESDGKTYVTITDSLTCRQGAYAVGLTATRNWSRPENSHFDPNNPLTNYHDDGSCGPRGDDAGQDTSACDNGYYKSHEVHREDGSFLGFGYKSKANINGCDYYRWAIYLCCKFMTENGEQ